MYVTVLRYMYVIVLRYMYVDGMDLLDYSFSLPHDLQNLPVPSMSTA